MQTFLNCVFFNQGESVDNFNWGVRRPSLSHLEGGSNTSLSSASGISHPFAAVGNDGRGDMTRDRDKVHRLEHRHKHAGKQQTTGMGNDHDRSNRNELLQMEDAALSGTNSLRNITPVLQNRSNNRNAGVGAEESSDDEMGSVRL